MRSRLQGTEFCLWTVYKLWRFNIYHNDLVKYLNFGKKVDLKGSSFTETSIREVVGMALSLRWQLLHRAHLITNSIQFSFLITSQYNWGYKSKDRRSSGDAALWALMTQGL